MKRLLWISSLVAVAAVGLVIAKRPAAAHHSSTPFYDDTQRVEAVGTVSRFIFRNPHSFIFIDGRNEAGEGGSHGSSIGRVDEDALFYLQARGIDAAEARTLLVRGFAAEVLATLPEPALAESLGEAFGERLTGAVA
jgi:hypothetical protein